MVLGYAVLAGLRILLRSPFRRDLVAQPTLMAGATALTLVVGGAGILSLLRWPALLHAYSILAAAVLVGAWWRARPGYGRRLNWPPGSLGIGASLDAIGDRRYYDDQARLHGPVFKMSQFGRPVLCVLGLARARDLLLRHRDSLAPATLSYNRLVPGGSLRYMTKEEHQRESPLFRSALAQVDLASHDDVARRACQSALADLSADSLRSDDGITPRDHLGQWVFIALARVFFGLEPDDPRMAHLDRAQRLIGLERAGGRRWRVEMEESFETVTTLMRELAVSVAYPRGSSRANALMILLRADPKLLDRKARTRNLVLTFRLAVGDLTSLCDWVLTKLSENPEWQSRVRLSLDGPEDTPRDDVAIRVVLETLRMEQSEFLYRRVTRPIEIEGFDVPAGWLVRICIQESHRDPEIFPNPDVFDPERFAGRSIGRGEYAPFGLDDRGCMGVSIVHFFGRMLVQELCDGYRLRVTYDAPIEKGTRHRDHWRPSPLRRIVLTPLA